MIRLAQSSISSFSASSLMTYIFRVSHVLQLVYEHLEEQNNGNEGNNKRI